MKGGRVFPPAEHPPCPAWSRFTASRTAAPRSASPSPLHTARSAPSPSPPPTVARATAHRAATGRQTLRRPPRRRMRPRRKGGDRQGVPDGLRSLRRPPAVRGAPLPAPPAARPDLPRRAATRRIPFPYLELLGQFDRLFGGSRTPYISAWHQAPTGQRAELALQLQLFTISAYLRQTQVPGRRGVRHGCLGQRRHPRESGPPAAGGHFMNTTAAFAFAELYGHAPKGACASASPVNLIGEHTDYNHGFVLPIALPHATHVEAHRRGDGLMQPGRGQDRRAHDRPAESGCGARLGQVPRRGGMDAAPGRPPGWRRRPRNRQHGTDARAISPRRPGVRPHLPPAAPDTTSPAKSHCRYSSCL